MIPRHAALAALVFLLLPAAAQTPSSASPAASPASAPAAASAAPEAAPLDPAGFLGASLAQAAAAFGPPDSVFAVRGPEEWQDDVVFRYDGLDLYWFRDRVWQVRVQSAYGVSVGDAADAAADAAAAKLGPPLARRDDALVYQLGGKAWPQRARFGLDGDGRVESIYVYRADF